MTNTEPGDEGKTTGKDQFTEALQHVWWAGLGLAAVAGEQGERLLQTLVEKGKEVEPTVREQSRKVKEGMEEVVDDVGARLKGVAEAIGRGAGKAESAFDEKVSGAFQRMGFPTREDIESLKRKIDDLTARLERLQERP
jgi:poly(hydroxyalkanoate) granule-associated protein